MLGGASPVPGPNTPGAFQREPASATPAPVGTPAANPSMAGQLGAMWEQGVVVPLARAADRLGREKKDLVGARTDLTAALQTISTVRDGTPADDPNRLRLTSVERIVKGVLDVVEQRLGGSTSDSQFERELMALRFEAVELQPMVTHKPPIEGLVGAILGEGAAGFKVPPSVAQKSAADLWKIFVINYLWEAQRDFGKRSAGTVWSDVLGVGLAIQQFGQAAPDDDPVGPRLFALEAAATALLSRLKERVPADDFRRATADDLAGDAERAYGLGVEMKRILTGEPATAKPASGPGESAGEPNFTWESKDPLEGQKPFKNDTDLMRPGE